MKLHLTSADWTITLMTTAIITAIAYFIMHLKWLTPIPTAIALTATIYAFESIET